MSEFSLRELTKQDRYKLLSGIVIPRPIALVTTLDANGAVKRPGGKNAQRETGEDAK